MKAHLIDTYLVAQVMQFLFFGVENIAGKGENTGFQHFFLFPQCFQKSFFNRVVKSHPHMAKC